MLLEENANALASQQQVEHVAHHDNLTGLPNRLLAVDRFAQAIAIAGRKNFKVALMFIDLDNFKLVNDTLGHEAGDQYLIQLASRLKKSVREVDTVCRFGGDEFLIVLNEIQSYEHIIRVADNLIKKISHAITVNSVEFEASGSIGISIWPDDGNEYDLILRNADMAMYHAKDTGKNNFQFYNDKLNQNLLEHIQLVSDLKVALNESQFELYFQPKISFTTGKVIGAEALIRWHHPERGIVPPDIFIPIAEKSGMIADIGSWVLGEACKKCKNWQDAGFKDVSVAVNVSPIQFMHSDIYSVVKAVLEQNDFCAKHLELEITESLLLDESTELINTFKNLNKLKVKLSIDDFGTGYSNLKYLKLFHISLIKIDKSFIFTLDKNTQDKSIVSAIIQMAHSLGMEVVAEGVEEKVVCDFLKQDDCDYGQGYYWAKPLPEKKFIDYLKNHH